MSNTNGKHWIRDERRNAIINRDGKCCVYCSAPVARPELDHVLGRITHNTGNLVVSCRACNGTKGSADLVDFVPALRSRGIDPNAALARVLRATHTHVNVGQPTDQKILRAVERAVHAARAVC